MKKFISILIFLAAFVFTFVSCKSPVDNGEDKSNNGNSTGGNGTGGNGTGGNGTGGNGTGGNGNSGNSDPVPAQDKLKIGSTTYEYTGEVLVMETDQIIEGNEKYILNKSGAFPKGRTVKLSPFIMGKYEVTQELYEAVMTGQKVPSYPSEKELNASPSYCTASSEDCCNMLEGETQKYRPVEYITWFDAVYFCNALSEKTGLTKVYTITNIVVTASGRIDDAVVTYNTNANGYRLPTEAEWEYAARGGEKGVKDNTFEYFWSGATTENIEDTKNKDLDAVGWYKFNLKTGNTVNTEPKPEPKDKGYGTHQVGKKDPNSAGIYDMSGNVWEWVYDRYDSDVTHFDDLYTVDGIVINPLGSTDKSSHRILRGGCWLNDYASVCAVSNRYYTYGFGNGYGFRVCRNAK